MRTLLVIIVALFLVPAGERSRDCLVRAAALVDTGGASGQRNRERRQLWVASLDAGTATQGGKVIGLNPFHP